MSLSNSINSLAKAIQITDEEFIQRLISFLEGGEEVSVNYFTLSYFFEKITRVLVSVSTFIRTENTYKRYHKNVRRQTMTATTKKKKTT